MTTRADDTPQILQRRRYLQRMDQERTYRNMVKDVEHPKSRVNFISEKRQSPLHSAGVGLNILLASLTAFFLGYWAAWSYFQDNIRASSVGVVCAGCMLALETVLYISRSRRLDAMQKDRRTNHRRSEQRRAKRMGPSREAMEARKALESWLRRKGITTDEGGDDDEVTKKGDTKVVTSLS